MRCPLLSRAETRADPKSPDEPITSTSKTILLTAGDKDLVTPLRSVGRAQTDMAEQSRRQAGNPHYLMGKRGKEE